MKPSKIPATLVLLVLFAASVSLGATDGHAQPLDSVTGDSARVIVKLRSDSPLMREKAIAARPGDATRAKALGRRIGLALGEGPAVSEHAQVVVATGLTSAQLAEQLARESDVEFAVPDQRRHVLVAPNDPLYQSGVPGNGPFVGQWYLRAPDAEVRSSLNVEPAWAITTGDPNLVVAVVDTGVRYEHPDLLAVSAGGNLLPGYDMISDSTQANDGDGRDADASDPGDWVTQAELSQRGPFFECMQSPRNSSWHGTRVSSLIATLTDNGIGMASVGRNVRLLPVRALGKCGGFDSDIIAAMRWAAGLAVPGAPSNPHPARVINLSFGEAGACGAAYRQTVSEINARGAVIVAAAGNSAGHAVITPANCPGIIAVAGLRHVGSKVGFSDLGPEIALAAPGGNCVNVAAGSPCLYSIIAATDSGLTTAVSPTYTDSFNRSVGTSFASPLVAGTAALMLSAQPSLTPERVSVLLRSTARPFPTTGGDLGAATPVCRPPLFTPSGDPIDQLECYCTTGTCGAGMLDAGAAVSAASANQNHYQVDGMWWNAPAGSESGWGINLAHQGDIVFATWFTYDSSGKAWWLSMTAPRVGDNVYSGTLYETRGPRFDSVPFVSGFVVRTAVGSATLAFSGESSGTFSYTVNGVTQSKGITRQVFAALPSCTFGQQANLALATNYQDLWWNAPEGSEPGWGINLTHQGDIIFATWFTYDVDGTPLWLSATASSTSARTYAGTLYRATGPAFNAAPFAPTAVRQMPVGSASLQFIDGNSATFAYTVNGVSQTKSITRQVFRAPGTVCR